MEIAECEVCKPDGAMVFFDDDPTLLAGDFDNCERLELLLERLPVSRKGKRSFMRAEIGVPRGSCAVVQELLGVDVGRSLRVTGVETGAGSGSASSVHCSDGGFFEAPGLVASRFGAISNCFEEGSQAKTCRSVARAGLFPDTARGVHMSNDSRKLTVVSSFPVCEEGKV